MYETTGRGGFIIHPYIKGLEDSFELGQEIQTYVYGNFEELRKTIDWYLENDELRERVRMAGHERTKRDHTYTQRLQTIIETVKGKQQSVS